MPPQLALLLVSIFTVIILYIDDKQFKGIGPAKWIPALWLLYSGSKGLGYWFNVRTTIEAGNPIDRYFLLSLGVLGFFILSKRRFSWNEALKKNHILSLIILYMLISTVWSRVPGISFRRWGREVIALIIGCLITSEKYPIRALLSAFRKVIFIALPYSLLLIKYYPQYGRDYHIHTGELMWLGIAGQKNGLALICSFSAIFLIWSLSKDLSQWKALTKRIPILIDLSMLILSVYLMMGPRRTFKYSSTSFIALLIGLIFIIVLRISMEKKTKIRAELIIIATMIILIGTFMPFTGKIPIKGIPELLGRDSTLTGRTQIWNALVPYAQKRLILGHGFGGFWTTSLREQIAITSHNGYLDTILNLGLIGLIIFSFFLISLVSKCYKLTNNAWDITLLFLSMIFMFLIHNIAEASLGYLESFPSSLIVLFSFIIHNGESKINSDSEKDTEAFGP